jgi:hypothetical protein
MTYPPIPATAPFLFENQDKPFAGDTFMEAEFLRLRDQYGIKTVIETGTCYASTALWFAEHFSEVLSCEVHAPTLAVARLRTEGIPNLQLWEGPSQNVMAGILIQCAEPTLCFLDAHFEKHCPLLDELKAIASAGIKPVIVIHDFLVPGRLDLGFDTWNGQRFTFEWVKPYLDRIYGTRYAHYYNQEATGAKRGVLYVVPI